MYKFTIPKIRDIREQLEHERHVEWMQQNQFRVNKIIALIKNKTREGESCVHVSVEFVPPDRERIKSMFIDQGYEVTDHIVNEEFAGWIVSW